MTEEERTQADKQAVQELFRLINFYGNDRELVNVIVAHLRNEHRTLQQTFWRVIRQVAEQYQDFHTDLRNESAVKFAKAIAEISEHMPLI